LKPYVSPSDIVAGIIREKEASEKRVEIRNFCSVFVWVIPRAAPIRIRASNALLRRYKTQEKELRLRSI